MVETGSWRDKKRTVLRDVVPLDTPYCIAVETSASCNAKCVYCIHSQRDFGGNMSMDIYIKLLSDLKSFPKKIKKLDMYCFGEPLCNPNLAKMICLAKRDEISEKVDFITNGILFDNDRCDEIIDSGVDTIRISLQGLDSDVYKRVCGVNLDFGKFVENLTYLYEHKKQAKIFMKIADIALEGVENGRDKLEEIFGKISDGVYVEHIMPFFAGVDYHMLGENIDQQQRDGSTRIKMNNVCSGQFYKMRIAYNGDITSACCDPDRCLYLGNVEQDNITEIWNGRKWRAFLKMQLQGKRYQRPECKDCVTPNDVGGNMDVLDGYEEEILQRMKDL